MKNVTDMAGRYITDPTDLSLFLEECKRTSLLALDTEFIREKTYYPQLCLIQLANGSDCAILDPFALDDFSALKGILLDTSVTKVVHAGDQDCGILYHELGCLPRPVFDTQRAAMLFGYSPQLGLAALVKAFCAVKLDKGDALTDWTRRPLTNAQVEYALNDVRYLPQIFLTMHTKLTASGRIEWLREDLERLSDEGFYLIEPGERWKKVKHTASLSPRQLAIVKEVAAWRELTAQKKDYPRKWVLTDELVVEIAKRGPTTMDDLFQIRGMRDKLGDRWSQEVIAAVQRGRANPPEFWPQRGREGDRERDCRDALDLMSALVYLRAKENHLATALLASHEELVRIACGDRDEARVLKSWRREIVGEELLKLLDGEIALSLSNNRLKVTGIPQ
ncbi:MAG: ribonuclease D [Coriobacteriales bacterium]|jgi:ribonuclease D|nr:ribonuclease D [Coriobacteriales bacterium]